MANFYNDGCLIVFALLQALIMLALTPLFTGISRQIRARMHSRRGPGIWQDYRDINKLLKRQEVAPSSSGLMFRLMPWVLLSSMMVVAMALPLFLRESQYTPSTPVPLLSLYHHISLYVCSKSFCCRITGSISDNIFASSLSPSSRGSTLGSG